MTKTWTRGYHEFKSIEGIADNGIVYHKVYRDDKLRFVSIGSWHIYTDDPAYINKTAREVAKERAEKALAKAEKQRETARREKELNKRERMSGANVNFTLSDLADLADLFDVDDTADICNHYATAYAF